MKIAACDYLKLQIDRFKKYFKISNTVSPNSNKYFF